MMDSPSKYGGSINLWTFFVARVSVTFHLACNHIIFYKNKRFKLLSGHLLGNSCSHSVYHMFSLYFDYL